MARRRDGWRKAAANAARDYPELKRQLRDLQSQSVTPNLNGMPSSGEPGRSTEDAALRQLPWTQQRRLDAVEYALNVSSTLSSGPSRVRLIELVYFQPYNRRFLVQGAAMQIPVSVDLAWRWNSDFLHLVWSKLK
jgi:hypothetical protein